MARNVTGAAGPPGARSWGRPTPWRGSSWAHLRPGWPPRKVLATPPGVTSRRSPWWVS